MTLLRIHRPDINLPAAQLSKIELSFTEALQRFDHIIREGEITLRDLNGPKGGLDKQCKVQLRLYPRGMVVVKGTGSTFLQAVSESCDKIRHVVSKRLSKRKKGPNKRLSFYLEEVVHGS